MKKSQLYILLIVLSSALLASCGSTYTINGTTDVSSLDGQKFILRAFCDEELKAIDSCDIVHGQFNFKGTIDSLKIAYITNEACVVPVILEEGEIAVSINMAGETISGTTFNNKFSDFQKALDKVDGEINDLPRKQSQGIMIGENEDSLNVSLDKKFQMLIVKRDSITTKFICNNFDNILAAAAFQYLTIPLLMQGGVPQLTPWIEEILSKANDDFKNDAYVKFYLEKAKFIEGVQNGTIELPEQQSNASANTPQPNNAQQSSDEPTLEELEGTIPTPNDLAAPKKDSKK